MIENLEARLGYASDDLLGEGPFWNASSQCLSRVDIVRGLVHFWWPATGAAKVVEAGGPVSLALPTTAGGLVLAVEDRIVVLDDGEATTVCLIEEDRPTTRLNDGACDQRGRLWVGTYSLRGAPEAGLYCVQPNGEVRQMLGGMFASNGLAWNAVESHMYVTDTGKGRVSRFAFGAGEPALSDEQLFCELSADEGLPDGIATDLDGGLWVAVYGGGAVRRYTGDGVLRAQARLPTRNPTSLAFGGADLDELFVTTARHRLSEAEYTREPLAGSVFAISSGGRGVPTHPFGFGAEAGAMP